MYFRLLISSILLFFMSCSPKSGHHGHAHDDHGHGHDDHGHGHNDHGHGGHHEEEELEPVVVTQFTEKTLLFMEYPQLIVGEKARFLAHFSILKTGDPAYKGTLDFIITDASGDKKTISLDKPKRDGLYIPEYAFTKPGKYKGEMILKTDLLPGSDKQTFELTVYASAKDVKVEEAEEDPGAITFLLEQQWKIPVTYAKASKKKMSEQLKLTGEVVMPVESRAKISALHDGIVSNVEGKSFPGLGDEVKKGDVLAVVKKQLSVTELAEFNSNRSAVKSFDNELKMRQIEIQLKKLELTKDFKELSVKKSMLQSKLKKYRQMITDGLITELDLLEITSELELVNKKFSATEELQKALEQTVASLEQAKTSNSKDDSANGNWIEYKLTAPIDGRVSQVFKNNGESCSALEEIFLIQNPNMLQLTAEIPEFKLAGLAANTDLYFQAPGENQELYNLKKLGGKQLNVIGQVNAETRTYPQVYSLPNKDNKFKPGSFLNIYLDKETPREVLSIPESAIVRDNGLETVYVILDGEHFARRVVRTGMRDKGFVEIIDGLKEGEWIADKGAYLVKLASRSSEEFGHGHAH